MKNLNQQVNSFFINGCMRCPLGATPECKVHKFPDALDALRFAVLETGLTEELKWGAPCYTINGKNIVIIGVVKDCCTLGFFKGSLLKDPEGLLQKPGENSQAARIIRFTKDKDVLKIKTALKALIQEAVEIEKAGIKVDFKKTPEPLPDELIQKFEENSTFKSAFYALTPGRQRGYILHFSQPKQSATRVSRIEKCMPQIFAGKGIHDR